MLKPMLPTLSYDIPANRDHWVYEVKYDGFRALLHWSKESLQLISRNGNSLNEQFPEVINFCLSHEEAFKPFLPLVLDGELCLLESSLKASFEAIQQRGRLKNSPTIKELSARRPAHYCVFDLLVNSGKNLQAQPFSERKKELSALFENTGLGHEVDHRSPLLLQFIPYTSHYEQLWTMVKHADGEGVIAKKLDSKWDQGKRTVDWLKIKNWKKAAFFIIGLDKQNTYFHVGVVRDKKIFPIGLFSHGLSPEQREALIQVIKANKSDENNQYISVEPGICVELSYLEVYKEQLRQPSFSNFLLTAKWEECTWEKLFEKAAPLPEEIEITHPDKPLWRNKQIMKKDYIDYLQNVSSFLLPFLENRLLTVIRFPHGMDGEKFYQKNCPDYAPDFIRTFLHEGIDYIICNDLKSLIWLGNQLAFEFHIPFQTIYSKGPSEIVFDLDPPSRAEFPLAVKAAIILKEVFDGLSLLSFVKTSGNKGLQIYLPLPENTFSYDDTRLFTTFIADFLVSKEPDLFTTERLKKNRGNKLYVDYVQHAEGKTIIAPYSVRGNEGAFAAAPLFWEEVNEKLSIENFPLEMMKNRLSEQGDPFKDYFTAKDQQPFQAVLDSLSKLNRP